MHITIATTEFVTEKFFSGGLGNYTANLASILAEHEHIIDIVVLSDRSETLEWKRGITVWRVKYVENISTHHLLSCKLIQHYKQGIWNLIGASYVINKTIRKINKKNRIQVIHYCDAGALALLRPFVIPSIVRLSSYPPLWRLAECEEFDYDLAFHQLTQPEKVRLFALKHAKKLISPSEIIAEIIKEKLKKDVEVIESPFYGDIAFLDDSLYQEKLFGKKYFLFFGTLGYLKGIHVIAEILEDFFARYADCDFVFIGKSQLISYQGEEVDAVDYLQKKAGTFQDRVIYFEPISNKWKLYSLISHAIAIVLPSRIDNLPNTCIEAMWCQKIVIGTRGASFEQLITHGYNGWLIKRDSSADLMDKIDLTMNMTEEEKLQFGKRAKERLNNLKPDMVYKKMMTIYNEVIYK